MWIVGQLVGNAIYIVNTSDVQASSGPKLVDFKAALVKPENGVVTGLTLFSSATLSGRTEKS